MVCGKAFLCVALLMLFGLGGSVAQSNSTKDAAKETPVSEAPASIAPQPEEATEVTVRPDATRVLDALRAELTRRRTERQQQQLKRMQERREQILRTLESLSERKREYELRRQEALQDSADLREARRLEMEARRAGRLPVRERDRVNRARLEQLTDETPAEENEIGSSADGADEDVTREVASDSAIQRVRNLLLIEEANGNLRLIDLDTEEGQQVVLEGVQRAVDGEVNEGEGTVEEMAKRRLKIGQI